MTVPIPVSVSAARPLRVLVMTKIFPNAAQPGWAPFNRQQFAALSRLPQARVVEVLATLPYFPGVGRLSGRSLAAGLIDVPRRETIDGLDVGHPRTLYLPRVGHGLAGGLYAASVLPWALRHRGRIDVVLAAWAYPDGCGAVLLGPLLGAPVVVKLHGSDINVGSELYGPRFMMRRLLPRAARVVAVSAALRDKVVGLGVSPAGVDVVRNGVDRGLFYPRPRDGLRRELGLKQAAPLLVCVSRVEREKGTLDLLEAFAAVRRAMPAAELHLIGGGAALSEVRARAAEGVRAHGPVPLHEVPRWMGAADVVVLPSWAEGLPNTVLEALSCGRPAVSTDVGGVGEVLCDPQLGLLVPARQPARLAEALLEALSRPWDTEAIARRGPGSWEDSARALLRSLCAAVGRPLDLEPAPADERVDDRADDRDAAGRP